MFKAMLNRLCLAPRRNGKPDDVVLALERLEDRLTPSGGGTSANTWTDANGTGLWSDKLNWSMYYVPTTTEDAVFEGSPYGTSDSCLWASGNPIPQGLYMYGSYGGTLTVSFAAEVGVDGLDMEGGKISQSAATSTLTVDGFFNWTAGVLNSNSVLSTVTLQGGGTITGGSGALTTGSTLVIPSAVNYNLQGTGIYFNNEAGVTIQSTGQLNWNSAGTALYSGGGLGAIYNRGSFNFNIGSGNIGSSQLPFINVGGTLAVVSGTFNVTGSVYGENPAWASAYQSSGSTTITYGATLGVTYGFTMDGGNLRTSHPAGWQLARTTINGNVTVTGGTIDLAFGTPQNLDTLYITGTLSLTGGTLDIKVDGQNGFCDQIQTTGNITLGGGATLTVTSFNGPVQTQPRLTATFLQTAAGSQINNFFGTLNLAFNDGTTGAWTAARNNTPQGGVYQLFSS